MYCGHVDASEYPLILPIPRELNEHANHFILNEDVVILVPKDASDHDLFLARTLAAELADNMHCPFEFYTLMSRHPTFTVS